MVELVLVPDRHSNAELDRQLAELAGNPAKYQRMARKAGQEIRKLSRQRIRQQRNLSGSSFTPRQVKRKKRKMLLGLGKSLEIMSRASSTGQGNGGVVVGWKNRLTAGIAGRHQHGEGESWNPSRARQVYGVPDYKRPCTLRQARALLREGFRLPVPATGKKPSEGGRLKKLKRVSVRWLQEHFSLGQAGLILRLLRTGERRGKQSWLDTPPARSFLGARPEEVNNLLESLAQEMTRRI